MLFNANKTLAIANAHAADLDRHLRIRNIKGDSLVDSVIQLHEICKAFGKFRALDGVSVRIEPGVTGLLGPNGAGKSTLIKILLGLLKPTSGSGKVLGFDLHTQSSLVRENVGYMPEDDCYFGGLTGIESVQAAARLSGIPKLEGLRRAHEILDFCGAKQERYRAVHTYSTGMRQKLQFAMTIVHDPPLLILDEPTSGLDPEEREAMLNRIRILASKHDKSIVICTHILPDIQATCESVVILARGKVSVADRLSELSQPLAATIEVRTDGAADSEFIRHLRSAGLVVEEIQNRTLAISNHSALSEEYSSLTDAIWKTAHTANVGIRSLSPAKNSLENIFMNAVREQPNASA